MDLDLLDLRLNTLNDVVDYFVLVESSITHQGESKPFIFEENKQKYQKFLEKIIHIKVTNTPEDFSNLPNQSDNPIYSQIYEQIKNTKLFNRFDKNHNGFGRDFFQKECIKLGFKNCKDDDIVISSDLDEIPNPEYLSRLNEYFSADELYTFNQTHYCFYLNMLNYSHIDNTSRNRNITTNWKGSRMGTYTAKPVIQRGKLAYRVTDEFGSFETLDLKTFAPKICLFFSSSVSLVSSGVSMSSITFCSPNPSISYNQYVKLLNRFFICSLYFSTIRLF